MVLFDNKTRYMALNPLCNFLISFTKQESMATENGGLRPLDFHSS